MTTWVDPATIDTAVDKPITTSKMTALKNNPLALAEGDVSAPAVEPKGFSPMAFFAHTAQGTLNLGADRVLIFSSEDFDTDGFYDNATGKFQPSVAGYYHVTGQVTVATAESSSNYYTKIRKNGTTAIASGIINKIDIGASNEGDSSTLCCIVYLNGTTDFIEITCLGSGLGTSTYTIVGGNYCYFGAHLLGGK